MFFSCALLVLVTGRANSFTFQPQVFKSAPSLTTKSVGASPFALRMSEPDNDGAILTTNTNKEIGYDADSGRFFETRDDKECEPEDEYCVLDKESGKLIRLTVEEKERIWLDSLQSYYINGRQLLNDSEFDLLKSDLQWNGSPLVTLNRDEAKYLSAVQAYLKGEPMMGDVEFDALKAQLKEDKSQFAVSTEPKCYIDTGICTVTFQVDSFRDNLLYLPAGVIFFIAWLGVGYETLGLLIKLNPLVLSLFGAYPIYQATKKVTEEFIFANNKIAYGPCPGCEVENRVYFGDILGVEGFGDVANLKCTNCKAAFRIQRNTLRASTLPK